jgi:hypothetical protein
LLLVGLVVLIVLFLYAIHWAIDGEVLEFDFIVYCCCCIGTDTGVILLGSIIGIARVDEDEV